MYIIKITCLSRLKLQFNIMNIHEIWKFAELDK